MRLKQRDRICKAERLLLFATIADWNASDQNEWNEIEEIFKVQFWRLRTESMENTVTVVLHYELHHTTPWWWLSFQTGNVSRTIQGQRISWWNLLTMRASMFDCWCHNNVDTMSQDNSVELFTGRMFKLFSRIILGPARAYTDSWDETEPRSTWGEITRPRDHVSSRVSLFKIFRHDAELTVPVNHTNSFFAKLFLCTRIISSCSTLPRPESEHRSYRVPRWTGWSQSELLILGRAAESRNGPVAVHRHEPATIIEPP